MGTVHCKVWTCHAPWTGHWLCLMQPACALGQTTHVVIQDGTPCSPLWHPLQGLAATNLRGAPSLLQWTHCVSGTGRSPAADAWRVARRNSRCQPQLLCSDMQAVHDGPGSQVHHCLRLFTQVSASCAQDMQAVHGGPGSQMHHCLRRFMQVSATLRYARWCRRANLPQAAHPSHECALLYANIMTFCPDGAQVPHGQRR